MLPLVALAVFALMGMAALVVDLGIARLTQAGLQTSADVAVIEGLRWRDELPPAVDAACAAPDPAARRDCARRAAARDLGALLFDESAAPLRPVNPGAGPVFELTGGAGNGNAFQHLAPGTPAVYRPRLELNHPANATHGDVVAGAFDPAGSPAETAAYARGDFTPAAAATSPSASALLVRLRRVRAGNEHDAEPGVSASGPPLPLLFGRGSTLAGGDPDEGYSVRHHGLSIRSVAIAGARTAAAVGRRHPALGLGGAAAFALRADFWRTLTRDTAVTATSGPAGSLVSVSDRSWRIADSVGAGACPAASDAPPAGPVTGVVVPIFACVDDVARIVAFGVADVDADGNVVRRASRIVVNASASPGRPPSGPALSAAAWAAVLEARRTFADDPALAPALVR